MTKRSNIIFTIVLSFFFFLLPIIVNAEGTATTSFTGNNSVYIGNNIEVTLKVNSVTGSGLAAFGGTISYSNNLELIKTESVGPFAVELAGSKLGGFGQNTIKNNTNVMKFTFKAKELGNAKISYSGSSQPDADAKPIEISGCSKTINITNPPSTNNYLKSLSVDKGSISFNKNTTSYSVSLGSDVDSINISATPEDSGAKVSGTGSKSLNYGNNKFEIVVTAPSGDKKTYTVTVNRKDIRSSNNDLSSLKVSSGELSPKFSSNTTSYTLTVPYEVENLKVTATASDSKAKVTVSGNSNLVAESTKDVTVTVTAENGSKKTYTIKVTRGKDPNKKLSNNNYLTHLTASVGILSPVFDKEVTNYAIWLPYEIDKITFDYQVEDTKYAKVKYEGNEDLQPGISNIFTIKVTAESGEERVYTISVNRASLVDQTGNGNTYLKSIELEDGKINGKFNKDTREYYYKRGKNFKVKNVVPEDENSAVSIYEDGNTIYFIVQSSNGEYGVYTLRENEFSILPYMINITILLGGFTLGFITHRIIIGKNKKAK